MRPKAWRNTTPFADAILHCKIRTAFDNRPPAAYSLSQIRQPPAGDRLRCIDGRQHPQRHGAGWDDDLDRQRQRQVDRVAGHRGLDRSEGHRCPQALRADRILHLRSGLHGDRGLPVEHHLYRRRRRHPSLSRLSDPGAGREQRFHGGLLSAALRRIADRQGKAAVRLRHHPSHDGT